MFTYTVSRGDNLTALARRFGISIADIANANGIADINLIQTGQLLNIPTASTKVTVNQDGTLEPVQITAQRFPVYQPTMPSFNFREWLKPPKLYYLIAAIATGAYFMSKDKRR